MRFVRALGAVFACAACTRASPPAPAPPPPTLEASTLELAAALEDGAADRVGALMGAAAVGVEVRQRLSETDDRVGVEARDPAALRAWVGEHAREWRCDGGCRWERGLVADGPWTCAGDCCDVGPRPMQPRTLYLQRACFAAREGAARRLTYVGFVEVR